jgi:hypothetical protein
MRQYLEPDDIINSIKLLLKHPFYADKLILVVEGKSDIRLFRSLFNQEKIKIESIDGKKQLIKSMQDFIESYRNKVLSICDADFDHIESMEDERLLSDIYLTDFHDAEVMMLKSNSLNSFIDEYSQSDKLLYLKNNLLNKAFNASKTLGLLRYINFKKDMKINFKKLNFSQFLVINPLTIDININLEILIDILISRSPKFASTKEDLFNYYNEYIKNDYDDCQINCGHDLTNIISYIFRQKEFSIETNMDVNKVESALRLSYQQHYFKETKLYKNINSRINIDEKS